LNALQSDLNRLFTSFFDTPTVGARGVRRWVPAMDLVEGEDHYVLRADLPGLALQDVAIEVHDRVLTVAGERKVEHDAETRGFARLERAVGTFRRALTLPEGVDADAITASLERGVLTVRIPKPEARKPRRVAISVGEPESAAIEGQATAA
jgi:HSP20 family protein